MAHNHKQKRFHMEALETRRVLTVTLNAIGANDSFDLVGPQPTDYIDVLDTSSRYTINEQKLTESLTESSTDRNLTNLFLETSAVPSLEPSVLQSSLIGNTSTLGLYLTGNQLIIPETPQINLGSRNTAIQTATINVGVQPTLDIQPTLLQADVDASPTPIGKKTSSRSAVVDLYAMLDPVILMNSELGSFKFGQSTVDRLSSAAGLRAVPVEQTGAIAGAGADIIVPRLGDLGDGLFDLQSSRLNLDVTGLPRPGSGGPSPRTGGLGETPGPAVDDENGPGLDGPDVGDTPTAPQLVTIDIGTNHPDSDVRDAPGLDIAVTPSLRTHRVEADRHDVIASDIDMARQHRLQLAAAARLPAPIGVTTSDIHSTVAPPLQLHTEPTATDLVSAVSREMQGEHWYDHWIAEARLATEQVRSPKIHVADERSDREEPAMPAPERTELLIDSHGASEPSARSRWQWAVDALLACGGIGAMIFHDRYGDLTEEHRQFRLRR